jgi:hypothetical protein
MTHKGRLRAERRRGPVEDYWGCETAKGPGFEDVAPYKLSALPVQRISAVAPSPSVRR